MTYGTDTCPTWLINALSENKLMKKTHPEEREAIRKTLDKFRDKNVHSPQTKPSESVERQSPVNGESILESRKSSENEDKTADTPQKLIKLKIEPIKISAQDIVDYVGGRR